LVMARAEVALGAALIASGEVEEGRVRLGRSADVAASGDPLVGFELVGSVAIPLIWGEQYEDAQRLIDTLVRQARRAGAHGLLGQALVAHALLSFRTDDLLLTAASAWEATHLLEGTGDRVAVAAGHVLLALAAAEVG